MKPIHYCHAASDVFLTRQRYQPRRRVLKQLNQVTVVSDNRTMPSAMNFD